MGKEQPLISIVMPVYNGEDTVERAIQSVQKQTCSNWELLAVDDGSSDRSGAICDRCAEKDPRIRVFHTPNAGVSHARNTALQAARGEWIAFLDSDDWYEPAFLQTMLVHAAHADMVICMARMMPAKQETTIGKKNAVNADAQSALEQSVRDGLMDILTIPVWNRMLRSACIQMLFDEKMSNWEDSVFVLQNWKNCKNVEIIPDCLYNHVCLSACSLSKKVNLRELECLKKRRAAYAEALAGSCEAMKQVTANEQTKVCNYFLKLVSVKEKSRQDKLLVMGLQINETLFRPSAPYGVQCHGVYRLLWRALQTEKPAWIYFVFCVLGKPYMGIQHMQYQIRRRHARK